MKFAWSASTVSGLVRHGYGEHYFTEHGVPHLTKSRVGKGYGEGNLRGGRAVARDLGVARCGEDGVRSGEDGSYGDEERHDPNTKKDNSGAIVLAEETRDSHRWNAVL